MTRTGAAWRLLVHRPADGAWNMAVDEAILESYAGASPPDAPTLRLYGWDPPALSLGRFQSSQRGQGSRYLRERGIDLVRRPTGGAAVLHDRERTYAVIGRMRHGPFPGGVLETYRALAETLCAALRGLGLDARAVDGRARPDRTAAACFAAPSAHEITVEGAKLVGSAQLRRRGAFLQHGSIPMRADPEGLARATGLAGTPPPHADLSRLAPGVTETELDRALVSAFRERFAAPLRPGALDARETERATLLRGWKYHSARWTLEGKEAEKS